MLYFIPCRKGIDRPSANALIKGDIFDQGQFTTRYTGRGPGETDGMLVGHSAEGLEYHPELQTWQACENGAYWVGYDNASKPTPEDLQREGQIDGHVVELADGNKYLVPILRIVTTGLIMPAQQSFFLSPDGNWVSQLKPEFVALGQKVERLWDTFTAGIGDNPDAEIKIDVNYEFELIEAAINLNYRLSKWELSLLRLLDPQNTVQVLQAMIDLPTIIAIGQKKKHIDSGSTNNGGQD